VGLEPILAMSPRFLHYKPRNYSWGDPKYDPLSLTVAHSCSSWNRSYSVLRKERTNLDEHIGGVYMLIYEVARRLGTDIIVPFPALQLLLVLDQDLECNMEAIGRTLETN
jgi:hypothetical protein